MKALVLALDTSPMPAALNRDDSTSMLRILDTPVLELLVKRLKAAGITQIMIYTSSASDSITRHFGDGRRFGVEIAYTFEGYLVDGHMWAAPAGSAGAIRKIQRHAGFFDEPFVVLSGATVIDIDFAALFAEHNQNRALATIALAAVPSEELGRHRIVLQDETGMVTGFQRMPSLAGAGHKYVDTGVYMFEPSIVGCIGHEWPLDIGNHVLPGLIRDGLAVHGARLPLTWLELGTLADYHRVSCMALEGQLAGYDLPGRELAPGLYTGLNVRINPRRCDIQGPVVIAGSARVEDGAVLVGPCYIGAGALVACGARVERSIVLEHARIGAEADLRAVVTDGEYCFYTDGSVIDLKQAKLPWVVGDVRMHESAIKMAEQRFLDSIH
jgi:mannose-1-phosphate guanylyltransferase